MTGFSRLDGVFPGTLFIIVSLSLLSKFNLNDNGVVLSYIFSHVKKYSDFLDMCEVKEDSKEDRGVLIYK